VGVQDGDVVWSSPAIGRRVYFGSFDGYLYALNGKDAAVTTAGDYHQPATTSEGRPRRDGRPARSRPKRCEAVMAMDTQSGKVVAFQGAPGHVDLRCGTNTWRAMKPPGTGSGRDSRMAYDADAI